MYVYVLHTDHTQPDWMDSGASYRIGTENAEPAIEDLESRLSRLDLSFVIFARRPRSGVAERSEFSTNR